MADKKRFSFSNLNDVLFGNTVPEKFKRTTTYNINSNPVIYSTDNKEDYEAKKLQLKQEKLLAYQWIKAGYDNAQDALAGLSQVKVMYRDADLMCSDTYIASALEIATDEACCLNAKGNMLNIYSKSERIKSILEDLFYNRLDIKIWLPAVCYNTLKYGNQYMLLNLDKEMGIKGWRELPPYDMERYEGGVDCPYISANAINNTNAFKPQETKFFRLGKNEAMPYRSWQIAHFRNLQDTFFLPYGVSYLHKARRAWKMLSMMEDGMLIYRLDKSIERRVFKIYVGAIDDADVPAYVQQVANNFKRQPIVDPQTGQLDLRKSYMDVSTDYFIPVRSENAPTPIETLSAANNNTIMDDIEYMKNKVLAALRIPKGFLNFQEAQGKSQNLSIMDIRFCRMINRIQQYLLMELNKIAIVHLYLMGFEEELTNFSLTMNNPSSQIEAQDLEDITKRATVASQLLADPGNGIQIWSMHRVLKEVMKMSDKEIADNLNEIRLEKALAMELQKTDQIIQRTGLFDPIDNIYGEIGAEYQAGAPGENGGIGGGAPSGGGFGAGLGGDMGGDIDALGGPDDMGGGDISGAEGSTDMSGAPSADSGAPMENRFNNKPLLMENKERQQLLDKFVANLMEKDAKENDKVKGRVNFIDENLRVNEDTQLLLEGLERKLDDIENEFGEL